MRVTVWFCVAARWATEAGNRIRFVSKHWGVFGHKFLFWSVVSGRLTWRSSSAKNSSICDAKSQGQLDLCLKNRTSTGLKVPQATSCKKKCLSWKDTLPTRGVPGIPVVSPGALRRYENEVLNIFCVSCPKPPQCQNRHSRQILWVENSSLAGAGFTPPPSGRGSNWKFHWSIIDQLQSSLPPPYPPGLTQTTTIVSLWRFCAGNF